MRRAILALGIVAGLCLFSIPGDACGDKSLRISRGTRTQRTMHPAAVLIYLPASKPNIATAFQSVAHNLQTGLKEQKHKVRTVHGSDELGQALNSREWDVVLTDLAEAGTLREHIDNSPSKPVVVPVASKETTPQVKAARNQYKYIVKDATKGEQYLDAIEDATRSRMKILAKKI